MVCADKISVVHKYCRNTIFNYSCQNPHIYLCMSPLDDIKSFTYFEFYVIFSPFFTPVNRDFQID